MKKIYSILFFLFIMLASTSSFAQSFSWSGFTTSSNSFSSSNSGVTMSVGINGSGIQSGYPVYVSASGGYLYTGVDWSNKTTNVKYTITFSKAVVGVTFLLFDVDQSATWDDKVTITAINENNQATYPSISSTPYTTVSGTNNNVIEGSANNTNTTGNPAVVSFGSKSLKSITIVYSTGASSPSDPASQVMGIGTITFGNVLPIDLLSFKADKRNSNAELKWETANAVNFSQFEIERSATGIGSFEKIGTVSASGLAAGNYTYLDANVQSKMSKAFYRLKMVDIDGNYKYSPVVMVSFDETAAMDVRPTLLSAGEAININLNAGTPAKYDVKLFDMTGRLLMQKNHVSGQVQLETAQLIKGIYIINVTDGTIPRSFRVTVQ